MKYAHEKLKLVLNLLQNFFPRILKFEESEQKEEIVQNFSNFKLCLQL